MEQIEIKDSAITSPETRKIVREGESFLSLKRRSETAGFPENFAKYAKSKGDVYFWPQGGFHVVTTAALAKTVMTSPDFSADRARFFISRMPNIDLRIIKDFFGVVGKMMVMSDDKEHTIRRNVASAGLNEKLLDFYEPMIQRTVEKLLTRLEDQGSIEFVEGIARQLPQSVLADLFCIPDEDRTLFNRSSGIMTGFFGGAVEYTNEVGAQVNESAITIRDYFFKLLEERRKNPKNDFFSGMLAMQKGLNLADDELVSQAIMMLVAGQVTTTDQICNNLYLMLQTPGVYQKLVENPSLLPTAIEEFKRLDPAVTFLFRLARKPVMLGDQPVEPGDTIFISNHAICRDPEEFPNPEEMILDRKANRHFAYGHGPHYCMGARLGRMQMNILFKGMTERFPKLVLDPSKPAIRDHYSLAFSGFKTMHILAKG